MGKTCKPYQIEGAEESAELELKVKRRREIFLPMRE